MIETSKVLLVGGFHEIIELCEACRREIVGIVDPALSGTYRGYPVLGNDGDASAIFARHGAIPVVLTPDLPDRRNAIAERYRAIGFPIATLVHPKAHISPSARLGVGVVVQTGAHVSSAVQLADFVRVNVNANVMHDCTVGHCATIAPNAVLLGRVTVGPCCYIGANATVLPNLTVGEHAVIGAGAVVTKSVSARATVKGNPAR